MTKCIDIVDFELFYIAVKTLSKIILSAKFVINESGFRVFSKNSFARFELYSSALTCSTPAEFCIGDLSKFSKILSSIEKEFDGENIDIKIKLSEKDISFDSSKIKIKMILVKEDVISQYVINDKVKTILTPQFSFKTSSALIRNILSNTYLFTDVDNIRINIIESIDNLDKNIAYAKMHSTNESFSNQIISKLGYITKGKINQNIIIDQERLQLFNAIESDEINIELMDKPFLVSTISKSSKDNKANLKLTIYNSLRKG